MRKKSLQLILCIALFTVAACNKNKNVARPPLPDAPRSISYGPAPEADNRQTSTPVVVKPLPQTPVTGIEAKPVVPAPVPQPPTPRPQQRPTAEARRDTRPSPAAESPAPSAPVIQLMPQISEGRRIELTNEIGEHLKLARNRMTTVNRSQLNEAQKTNLAAVEEFIRRADDAMKQKEYYQALVLAQKASTLAASLVNRP